MEVTYPAEVVLTILDRLGFKAVGFMGEILACRHPDYTRRLTLYFQPQIPEYAIIDSLESIEFPLNEYYKIRDSVLSERYN